MPATRPKALQVLPAKAVASAFPETLSRDLHVSSLDCCHIGNTASRKHVAGSASDLGGLLGYRLGMASQTHLQDHLFIKEWMEVRGISDEQLAGILGVARETIWKWRKQQHRLNPRKIATIAAALDIKPEQLWRPPSEPSLDAIVSGAPDEVRATAADIVKRLVRR